MKLALLERNRELGEYRAEPRGTEASKLSGLVVAKGWLV